MKKPIYKRLFAYAIDTLIVAIIASLFLDIPLINPYFERYIELSNEMFNYISGVEVLTTDAIAQLQYDFVYYSFYSYIILIVVKILYFIIFQYINEGQTIGKAIFKIQVISQRGKLKFYQLALSSLIVCNIITASINLVCLKMLNMNAYNSIASILNSIEIFIIIANVIMIKFRKDSRGLHDLISKTQVVYKEKES